MNKRFKKTDKKEISIHNFNNLQKILTLNLYDIVYVDSNQEKIEYIQWVKDNFSSKIISKKIKNIVKGIGARVLDSSTQDFKPYGSSTLSLIGENLEEGYSIHHLDKSHISTHSYFDIFENIIIYRIDIDISTCGNINPLNIMNNIFKNFYCDIIDIDFIVKGYTRDDLGNILYNDISLNILENIDKNILEKYKEIKSFYSNRSSKLIIKKDISIDEAIEYKHPLSIKDNSEVLIIINEQLEKIFKGL